jgi:hypothetical protein
VGQVAALATVHADASLHAAAGTPAQAIAKDLE